MQADDHKSPSPQGDDAENAAQTTQDDNWEMVDEGDSKIQLAEDGKLHKTILRHGTGPVPSVMSRAYVNIVGKLPDGTVFVNYPVEEFDFLLGRGEVPLGLQMAVVGMKVGEKAVIVCQEGYGYSDPRRPTNVPKDATLTLEVELLRFEEEKSVRDMTTEERLAYVERRRELGKELFANNKHQTSKAQYQKAAHVIETGLENGLAELNEQQKIKLKELSIVIYNNLAICELKANELDAALEHSNKVLSLDIDNTKALVRRAYVLRQRGEIDGAKRDNLHVKQLTSDEETLKRVNSELQLLEREQQKENQVLAERLSRYRSTELYPDKPLPPPPRSICNRIVDTISWPVRALSSLCRRGKHHDKDA